LSIEPFSIYPKHSFFKNRRKISDDYRIVQNQRWYFRKLMATGSLFPDIDSS
jgi:hypothetical protein